MQTGWWHITYTIEPNEIDLEHIATQIKEGYLQGQIVQENNLETLGDPEEALEYDDYHSSS